MDCSGGDGGFVRVDWLEGFTQAWVLGRAATLTLALSLEGEGKDGRRLWGQVRFFGRSQGYFGKW